MKKWNYVFYSFWKKTLNLEHQIFYINVEFQLEHELDSKIKGDSAILLEVLINLYERSKTIDNHVRSNETARREKAKRNRSPTKWNYDLINAKCQFRNSANANLTPPDHNSRQTRKFEYEENVFVLPLRNGSLRKKKSCFWCFGTGTAEIEVVEFVFMPILGLLPVTKKI